MQGKPKKKGTTMYVIVMALVLVKDLVRGDTRDPCGDTVHHRRCSRRLPLVGSGIAHAAPSAPRIDGIVVDVGALVAGAHESAVDDHGDAIAVVAIYGLKSPRVDATGRHVGRAQESVDGAHGRHVPIAVHGCYLGIHALGSDCPRVDANVYRGGHAGKPVQRRQRPSARMT